jgi:hypothetical protein
MAAVIDSIAQQHDRVDLVLHAGGLEISRLLPDKEPAEFDLVFDVKADGWYHLLHGLRDTDIGAIVGFSSIAGRFGNGGQADYSAANDLLCKSCLSFLTRHPDTTAISIDWTAWGDIGMATRGSIPTVMKAAGIDMLPAAIGTPWVREEITGDAGSREVLVAGALGILTEEFHESGGADVGALGEAIGEAVMIDTVERFGLHDGLVVSATLDPTEQGFLFDHQIDGTPVLPGVMGIEAFAEAALAPFDDMVVSAVEDVDFLAPFKFYRNEPRTLTITVRYRRDGDDVAADCELIGVRTLATSDEPQVTVHFTGTVRLSSSRSAIEAPELPDMDDGVFADDVYRIYFHGPTYRVLDRAWSSDGVVAGALADGLPANHTPEDAPTIVGPRLIELCFQTAGVFEIGTTGTMALPMHIDRVWIGGAEIGDDRPMHAIVRPVDGSFDAVVVDADGNAVVAIEGYQTITMPGALPDDEVAPLREAMADDG